MTDGVAQLADVTWPEVPVRPIVLVPLGSTEQHGPHLPFATDAVIATAVADAAAARITAGTGLKVVVAPTLPYGASGEHQEFAGTVSIGHDALRLVLVELIRSISTWSSRIVLVNGHGGNAPAVAAVVSQMLHERHPVSAVGCAVETPADAHAGKDETSILLHLRPGAVRMEHAAPGNVAPLTELLPALVAVGMRPVTPNGVLGDPTRATPAAGAAVLEEMVTRVVREVTP